MTKHVKSEIFIYVAIILAMFATAINVIYIDEITNYLNLRRVGIGFFLLPASFVGMLFFYLYKTLFDEEKINARQLKRNRKVDKAEVLTIFGYPKYIRGKIIVRAYKDSTKWMHNNDFPNQENAEKFMKRIKDGGAINTLYWRNISK